MRKVIQPFSAVPFLLGEQKADEKIAYRRASFCILTEENGKYIRARYQFSAAMRLRKEQWVQRKDYKFFTCPSCRTTLRVPRGHGKIKIVCRKCGNSFIGKS